jgi:hypothetical protein
LTNGGLRCGEWRPVFRRGKSGSAFDGVLHVFTDQFMMPSVLDVSHMMFRPSRDQWKFTMHNGLVYGPGALREAGDFNRTAEPWAGSDQPTWVLSDRAVRTIERRKLRGFAYWPVLEAGTEQYGKYLMMWETAVSMLMRFKLDIW